MSYILVIAEYVGALTTICAFVHKILTKSLDKALKPLNNQNRMQFRYNIVSFASDLHKGIPKTRDEFNSIFEQIDEYEKICKTLSINNHLFQEEVKFINKRFSELDILNKGKDIEK